MEPSKAQALIAKLRDEIARRQTCGSSDRPVLPSGFAPLDALLPGGGFPQGRVVELCGPPASGKTTLALLALSQATRSGQLAAFVDPAGELYPPAARALGPTCRGSWWCARARRSCAPRGGAAGALAGLRRRRRRPAAAGRSRRSLEPAAARGRRVRPGRRGRALVLAHRAGRLGARRGRPLVRGRARPHRRAQPHGAAGAQRARPAAAARGAGRGAAVGGGGRPRAERRAQAEGGRSPAAASARLVLLPGSEALGPVSR
jgi:hypothetical protein